LAGFYRYFTTIPPVQFRPIAVQEVFYG
jgi:hypothetical protein